MTVYGKIENNILIPAPYGKIEDLLAKGFSPFDDDLFQQCISGIITTDELVIKQENLLKKNELQSQIDELEKSQARAMREIALNISVEFAMGKLQSLNEQIQELRTQIAGL